MIKRFHVWMRLLIREGENDFFLWSECKRGKRRLMGVLPLAEIPRKKSGFFKYGHKRVKIDYFFNKEFEIC